MTTSLFRSRLGSLAATLSVITAAQADETLVPSETQRLVAPIPVAGENFGDQVAVSGDTMIVGVQEDATTGADNGAAYVYVLESGTWVLQAQLLAAVPIAGERFGGGVDIHGDTIVIGARQGGSPQPKGRAFVFVRSGTNWSEEALLDTTTSDTTVNFGESVSIWGDTIAIGAPSQSQGTIDPGVVHVFRRSGSTWTLEQSLTSGDAGDGDQFGNALDLRGERLLIGALRGTGAVDDSGAAYLFERSGSDWSESSKLMADDGGQTDLFGWSVRLGASHAAVGAIQISGFQGATYVFEQSGPNWSQETRLELPDGDSQDRFGFSLALQDDLLLVGAPRAGSNQSGLMQAFCHIGGEWTPVFATQASTANTTQTYFCSGLDLDGPTLVCGADTFDHDGLDQAGNVFTFELTPPFKVYCAGDGTAADCPCGAMGGVDSGCANSADPLGAQLTGSGSTSKSSDTVVFTATGLPVGFCVFFQGDQMLNGGVGAPFNDGLLCTEFGLIRLGMKSSTGGVASYPEAGDEEISDAGGVLIGSSRFYQVWYRDPSGPCGTGSNLSNGLEVVWTH